MATKQPAVTHADIYNRLVAVEAKVDSIDASTKDLVAAITAAQGAVKVLGWIASVAKPILWLAAAFGTATLFWSQLIKK